MQDAHGRIIDYLRISVTDRCNLRCVYCMPEQGIDGIPHDEILSFEEIIRICKATAKIGISKIKITGGEPLVRKGIVELIAQIKSIPKIEQVTITTNGVLLADMLDDLKSAGLDGVNISLDTLDREKFSEITRRDSFDKVILGLNKAIELQIPSIKINCLPAVEFNKDVVSFAALAKDKPISVRFIELMPIGLGRKYHAIPNEEIYRSISEAYGELIPVTKRLGNGPAKYFKSENFAGNIGFISAVSNEFCANCNRIRLTSEGFLKLCLHYNEGIDLREPLRSGISETKLCKLIETAIYEKPLKHMFSASLSSSNIEQKSMSQIGG